MRSTLWSTLKALSYVSRSSPPFNTKLIAFVARALSFFLSTTTGGRTMPVPSYERLGQEELVESPTKTDFNGARPATYYDDGPFDASSSDTEDETLLEKAPPSPGTTELGFIGLDPRENAPRKVSGLQSYAQPILLATTIDRNADISVFIAPFFTQVPCYHSRRARFSCGYHWNNCCTHICRNRLPCSWIPEDYYGPHLQWHILCYKA